MKKIVGLFVLMILISLTGCTSTLNVEKSKNKSNQKVLTPEESCSEDSGWLAKEKKWAEQGRDYFKVPTAEQAYYEVWKEIFMKEYSLDEETFTSTVWPWAWKSRQYKNPNNNNSYTIFEIDFHLKLGDFYIRNKTSNKLTIRNDASGKPINSVDFKKSLVNRKKSNRLIILEAASDDGMQWSSYDLRLNGEFPPKLLSCKEAARKVMKCDPKISAGGVMYKPALGMIYMSAGSKGVSDKCYWGASIELDSGKVTCGEWGACSMPIM